MVDLLDAPNFAQGGSHRLSPLSVTCNNTVHINIIITIIQCRIIITKELLPTNVVS
jgi:hypothetical protein